MVHRKWSFLLILHLFMLRKHPCCPAEQCIYSRGSQPQAKAQYWAATHLEPDCASGRQVSVHAQFHLRKWHASTQFHLPERWMLTQLTHKTPFVQQLTQMELRAHVPPALTKPCPFPHLLPGHQGGDHRSTELFIIYCILIIQQSFLS